MRPPWRPEITGILNAKVSLSQSTFQLISIWFSQPSVYWGIFPLMDTTLEKSPPHSTVGFSASLCPSSHLTCTARRSGALLLHSSSPWLSIEDGQIKAIEGDDFPYIPMGNYPSSDGMRCLDDENNKGPGLLPTITDWWCDSHVSNIYIYIYI